MKAFTLYHLSTLLDFSIILAIAAVCLGIYNTVMLKNPLWLASAAGMVLLAAALHVVATWLLEDAIDCATNRQLADWDLL